MQLDRYEAERKAKSANNQKPVRSTSFIQGMEQLARDRRQPFRDIVAQVHRREENEHGETVEVFAYQRYLDALEDYATNAFWSANRTLREIREREPMTRSRLEDRDGMVEEVRLRERNLDRDWRFIQDVVIGQPDDLFDTLQASAMSAQPGAWQDHHLQKHLLNPPRHMLEARYFLYCLRREIEQRQAMLDVDALRRAVEEDSIDPEARAQDGRRAGRAALPLAEDIAAQSVLRRLFASEAKRFAGKYVIYYNAALENISLFAEAALKATFYRKLLDDVNGMIRLTELLFADLQRLRDRLASTVAEQLDAHNLEKGAARGMRFVYADRAAKEDIWASLKPLVEGAGLSEEANGSLMQALFDEAQRRKIERIDDKAQFSVRALFNHAVRDGYCRQKLVSDYGDYYRFDIVEAVKRAANQELRAAESQGRSAGREAPVDADVSMPEATAAARNREWRRRLSDIVDTVGKQAQPFISLIDRDAGSRLIYWAVAPAVKDAINDDAYFEDLFRYENEVRALVEDAFDPCELHCVNLQYNFPITELSKMRASIGASESFLDPRAGRYDVAYRERVRALIDWKARRPGEISPYLTPHVDIRWLKPGLLPEIFAEVAADETERVYSAFAAANAFGFLKLEKDAGDDVFAFYDPKRRDEGVNRSIVGVGREMHEALAVFIDRPDVALNASDGAEAMIERLSPTGGGDAFEAEPTVALLVDPAAFQRLYLIAHNRNVADADSNLARVMRGHLDLLARVVRVCRSDLEGPRQAEFFQLHARRLADAATAGATAGGTLSADLVKRVSEIAANLIAAKKEAWR